MTCYDWLTKQKGAKNMDLRSTDCLNTESTVITARRFEKADAAEVSALITKTLRTSNIKDYSPEHIEMEVAQFTPDKVIDRKSVV